MTQFKAGDKVRVLKSDWPHMISVGTVTEVSRVVGSSGVYLTNPIEVGSLYFFDSEVELVEDKPEVGDTVEATFAEGTVLTGVVSRVYGDGDFYVAGRYHIDSEQVTVKIIEKVVKPKVWAVGDVMEGADYASETILKGTLLSDGVLRAIDGWFSTSLKSVVPISDRKSLSSARTIVFIPEV